MAFTHRWIRRFVRELTEDTESGGALDALSDALPSPEVDPADVVTAFEGSPTDATALAGVLAGGVVAHGWVSVPISSAELKDLHNTAKVLLAAPGGRLYHVVHTLVFHYRAGLIPYTGDFLPNVGYGSTVAEVDVSGSGAGAFLYADGYGDSFADNSDNAGLLRQADDAYLIASPGSYDANMTWSAWLKAGIEDKAFSLGNIPAGDPLDDGDGTMVVRVYRTIIDGAP